MGRLDLDAARAARAAKAEAQAEEHVIVLEAEEYTIPPEMPADFAIYALEGQLHASLRSLLDGQYDRFAQTRYSIEDLVELVEGVVKLYGFENLGEALASRRSSSTTGKRSRPTSKRTTA